MNQNLFSVPTAKLVAASPKMPLKNKNQNDLISTNTNSTSTANKLVDKTPQKQKQDSNHPQQQQNQNGTSSNPLRLLVGKLVFLDIQNSNKLLSKVKECLRIIEARIADCLSKDVNYVITNREKSNDQLSPSSNSQSQPESQNNCESNKKHKTSPNALNFLSRSSNLINRHTQAILQKASKTHQSTDILTTARRLGINVMNISELERYIEKYLNKKRSIESGVDKANVSIEYEDKQSTKGSNLNTIKDSLGPNTTADILSQCLTKKSFHDKLTNHKIYKLKGSFLKFESVCKQYKPIYQEFNVWHEINLESLNAKSTCSPFQVYFSDDNSGNISSTENDERNDPNKSNNSSQLQNSSAKPSIFKSPTSSTLAASSQVTSLKTKPQQSKAILTRTSSFSTNLNPCGIKNATQTNLVPNPQVKKKATGYCECCKQRYENLKQHLTSAQHDNFDRNLANFKEIDEYVNGVLNFRNFLVKNNLAAVPLEKTEENKIEDTEKINLDEIKEFAKIFSQKRKSLGISQSQIVIALNSEFKDPALAETAIGRFEKLDITPRSGAKIKPVLERLVNDSKLKFGDRLNSFTAMNCQQNETEISKKRKRVGSFSPQSLKILNDTFVRNPNPSKTELASMANKINYDEQVIQNWFDEQQKKAKPQTSKASVKKFKKANLVVNSIALALLNETNTSLLDQSSSSSSSSNPSPQKAQANPETLNEERKQTDDLINQNLTPVKSNSNSPLRLKEKTQKTPSLVSSLSLSSPTAAVFFGLANNNSFSIPHDMTNLNYSVLNTSHQTVHNTSATTKLLASKVDLISGNSDVQTIITKNFKQESLSNIAKTNNSNQSRSENSTDLSCIDDVVLAAFVNDFSYEIVQK